MAIGINPIQAPLLPRAVTPSLPGQAVQGPSFGSAIGDAIQQVDQLQKQANDASMQVATGQSADLHDAMIRVEEASLALQLSLQVRNKIVESYQEIMRMPV